MTKRSRFGLSLMRVKPIPVYEVARADSEVADVEGDDILEEVGALRGLDVDVGHGDLDDGFGAHDLVPLHGDSKRWVR